MSDSRKKLIQFLIPTGLILAALDIVSVYLFPRFYGDYALTVSMINMVIASGATYALQHKRLPELARFIGSVQQFLKTFKR